MVSMRMPPYIQVLADAQGLDFICYSEKCHCCILCCISVDLTAASQMNYTELLLHFMIVSQVTVSPVPVKQHGSVI